VSLSLVFFVASWLNYNKKLPVGRKVQGNQNILELNELHQLLALLMMLIYWAKLGCKTVETDTSFLYSEMWGNEKLSSTFEIKS
jgi:hypothetical protein